MKPYKIDFQSVEDLECEIIKKGEVKIYLTKKETEEFVYENIYEDFSSQFFGLKKEHSGGYVTDERRKNGRKRP